VVFADDQLIEQLSAVEIDRAVADFTAKNGNVVFVCKFQVNFLFGILMKADADIGRSRS